MPPVLEAEYPFPKNRRAAFLNELHMKTEERVGSVLYVWSGASNKAFQRSGHVTMMCVIGDYQIGHSHKEEEPL